MSTKSKSDSYAAAGVDITAGYKSVELMKQDIATYDPKSNGAQDYLAFTEELLEGLEK